MDKLTNELTNDKNFRHYAKNVVLTFKGWLYDWDIQVILDRLEKWTVIEWIGCRETGTSSEIGYEHTHLAFFTKGIIQTTNTRYFDIPDFMHPNIGKVKDKKRVINYIMKDGDFFGVMDFDKYATTTMAARIDDILSKDTKIEAFSTAKSMMEINAIATIYAQKDVDLCPRWKEKMAVMKPICWQIELWDKLEKLSNDREICWYWEKTGGNGKSSFANMWEYAHPDECITLGTVGKSSDVIYLICDEINSRNVAPKVIFMNLVRQFEGKEHIYSIAEQLKDGLLTNLKYQGKRVRIDWPHIVIFANFPPDLTKLTNDRWYVVELTERITHLTAKDSEGGAPVILERGTREEELI